MKRFKNGSNVISTRTSGHYSGQYSGTCEWIDMKFYGRGGKRKI